jgi:hypothetical protein
VRAPEGDPLGGIAALLGGPDRGAAPAAGPPGPPVHPGLLARPPRPVVTWLNRSLFASISRWAVVTRASRPVTSPTGRHGFTPRRPSTSALYKLPIPVG